MNDTTAWFAVSELPDTAAKYVRFHIVGAPPHHFFGPAWVPWCIVGVVLLVLLIERHRNLEVIG